MEKYYDRILCGNNVYNSTIIKLLNDKKEEIIRKAYENYIPGSHSGVVFLTPSDKLITCCWTSGTCQNPKSEDIEIYRLDQNWESQNVWDDHNMILEDQEWEKLKKRYKEEADFTDRDQVTSIGVDFDERMIEYLISCLG